MPQAAYNMLLTNLLSLSCHQSMRLDDLVYGDGFLQGGPRPRPHFSEAQGLGLLQLHLSHSTALARPLAMSWWGALDCRVQPRWRGPSGVFALGVCPTVEVRHPFDVCCQNHSTTLDCEVRRLLDFMPESLTYLVTSRYSEFFEPLPPRPADRAENVRLLIGHQSSSASHSWV